MEISRIEHIGIAVKNLQEVITHFETILGLSCYANETVEDQKVKTAFFNIGGTKIELLESTTDDGPIATFIAKRGQGLHHLAFEVTDLESSLQEVKKNGLALIDEKPRKGAENLNIAFIHPKSTYGVLTELCQPQKIASECEINYENNK